MPSTHPNHVTSFIIMDHVGLPLLRQHRQPAAQNPTRMLVLGLLRTHSFNRITRRLKEPGRHLLIPGVVGVLAIRRVGHSIKADVVIHERDRAVARRLAGCVLPDRRIQIDDPILGGLRPALGVQGQQVGENDVHLRILCAHLADQDVVGFEDIAGGLLADQDVVGAEQHEDDIRGVLVQPYCQVALGSVVCCLGTGVAFVVWVNVGATACARLGADEVEVCGLVVAELGLEVCAPTFLGEC